MKVVIRSRFFAAFLWVAKLQLICGFSIFLANAEEISRFKATPYPASTGAVVNLSVDLTETVVGESYEYQFRFGDGTASSSWLTSNTVSHSYQQPGHYQAQVQVRTASRLVGLRQVRITVLDPADLVLHKSNSSSSLAVDARTGQIWVVNPDNDSVSKVLSSGVVREFSLGSNCDPRSVGVVRNTEIWITCHDSDRIKILNKQGRLIKSLRLPYGSAPFGIAISPNQRSAYVTLFGQGALLQISTRTKRQTASLDLAFSARALAITANSKRLFVTRFFSPQDQGELWEVRSKPRGLKLVSTLALAADVSTPDTANSGRGVPNYLSSVTIAPNGRYALVTAIKANTARGLQRDGNDLNTVNTLRSMLARIDLVSNPAVEVLSERRDIDNSDSPSSLAFSPYGDFALVLLQGNNFVAVFDQFLTSAIGSSFNVTDGRLAVGLAPQSILFDNIRNRFVVHNFMSRSISSLSAAKFLKGQSAALERTDISTIQVEAKLSPEILTGKQIFYNASDQGGFNGANRMSSEGYFSCASCHIDGMHDGRNWDFTGRGEGIRNTTDLRGRSGIGHGRVHWSGNFDEIQDFENDIRNAFGGVGFMSDADFALSSDPLGTQKAGLSVELDALAAYVTSLGRESLPRSPYRQLDGKNTKAAVAGQKIFKRLNCESCHSGENFSDSADSEASLHNVGTIGSDSGNRLGATLTGIDTPTLLGLWASAPYLHNGSADTLLQVFEYYNGSGSTAHQQVADLSSLERRQLNRYLLELDGRP